MLGQEIAVDESNWIYDYPQFVSQCNSKTIHNMINQFQKRLNRVKDERENQVLTRNSKPPIHILKRWFSFQRANLGTRTDDLRTMLDGTLGKINLEYFKPEIERIQTQLRLIDAMKNSIDVLLYTVNKEGLDMVEDMIHRVMELVIEWLDLEKDEGGDDKDDCDEYGSFDDNCDDDYDDEEDGEESDEDDDMDDEDDDDEEECSEISTLEG